MNVGARHLSPVRRYALSGRGTPSATSSTTSAGSPQAFTDAATKELGPQAAQGPSGDAARLDDDWRTQIPEHPAALSEAWATPDAWQGMTRAGGVDLPAGVAGRVAVNELVIHDWDVARASEQPFRCDARVLDACMEFVSEMSVPGEGASREGLFGPVVEVPADAPLLDRVIGLSGRDPSWTPR